MPFRRSCFSVSWSTCQIDGARLCHSAGPFFCSMVKCQVSIVPARLPAEPTAVLSACPSTQSAARLLGRTSACPAATHGRSLTRPPVRPPPLLDRRFVARSRTTHASEDPLMRRCSEDALMRRCSEDAVLPNSTLPNDCVFLCPEPKWLWSMDGKKCCAA